jgi:hypothetical protein
MSEFLETINIKVDSAYMLNEVVHIDDHVDTSSFIEEIGGYSDVPSEIGQSETISKTGGAFNWGIYQDNNDPKGMVRVQLMRLWCTQMFVQIAKGKAFTNEADTGVDVILTEEEQSQLEVITRKVYDSLHKELEYASETMVVKRKPKKLQF